MSYSVQNIRNVCLLGHGGNGKTSLAESMLYLTGGTVRLGNPADGNTVCDYDPEEIRRQISISTAVAPVEYNGCKINVLDTPGYFDFSGEVIEALQVADAAIIVCSAKAGMSVGAEKAWKLCEQRRLPRLLHLQDRRGELRLQRRLRHPAGAFRQEYRPRGRPHLGCGQEGHWLYRRAPQARL